MSDDVPGWNHPTRRQDGMMIAERGDGTWAVLPPHYTSQAITVCPCCGLTMKTARHAKLVCNAV